MTVRGGELAFQVVDSRLQRRCPGRRAVVARRQGLAVKHRVEMVSIPAQRRGQRLEGPRAAAAFRGVVLDFPNDPAGDARARGQFALAASRAR
jgi:hypothetical protein